MDCWLQFGGMGEGGVTGADCLGCFLFYNQILILSDSSEKLVSDSRWLKYREQLQCIILLAKRKDWKKDKSSQRQFQSWGHPAICHFYTTEYTLCPQL